MKAMVSLLGILVVVGITVVLVRQSRSSIAKAGWNRFADARSQGMSVASLDAARDQAKGSPAEPWINFELALILYEHGTPSDFERALQIIADSESDSVTPTVANSLRELRAAITTFLHQPETPGVGG